MSDKLNPRQIKFAKAFAMGDTATQAAIKAGYSARGARTHACRMLANDNVVEAVEKERARLAKKIEVSEDQILNEIRKLAFSDMRNFVQWGPGYVDLVDSSELDKDAAACVAEVSRTESKFNVSVKFKLHDKLGALNLLAKIKGMLKDKVEVTGKDGKDFGPLNIIIEGNGSKPPPSTG